LRKEMEKPLPSREKVATLAAEAAKDLGERGAVLNRSKGQDPSGLANLFGGIAANPQLPGNWDTAVHTCLALVSLHQARSDMEPSARNAGVRKTLQGMLKDLSYPRGLDSPYNFTPEKFERDLQQLRK